MRVITVHIDFPALDNFVAFLRTNEQSQVDAVTAQIVQVTQSLKKSSSALQITEDANKLP